MKNLLFALTILISFTGCSKDESEDIDNKLYDVHFAPTGFTSETSSLKSGVDMTTYYTVFNSEGEYIKDLKFNPNESVADVLPVGDYIAYLAVSTGHRYGFANEESGIQLAYFGNWPDPMNQEAFLGKVEFSVLANSEKEVAVVLNRMSGKLEIIFEEELPAKTQVRVEFTGVHNYINLMDFTTYTSNNRNTGMNHTIGNEAINNLNMSTFCQPAYTGIADKKNYSTVTITCRDEFENIIGTKTIENVSLERNQKTSLRGKILSENGGSEKSSFTISLQEDWKEDVGQQF